jgi:hypothetical protein
MRTAQTLLVLAVAAFGARVAIAQPRAAGKPAPSAAASSSAAPASSAGAAGAAAPAGSASAAPTAPATPALADTLSGQAKADYDSARMLFGVSDYAGALIKFGSAYNASKDARLLYNMATCESKLHHYAKALGLMKQYVKDGGALLTDQDRADADAAVKAFEPLTSSVTINVSEPGASISVDDEVIGQSPIAPVVVDIGVHKVRVSKPEFTDFTADLTVSGSAQFTVDARLAPVVHEGHVSVRAGATDAIAIDGSPVGTGSWSGNLKSGGHTLRVTAEGMVAYQSEVLVQDGQSRDLSVTLNPEPSHGLLPTWAWIAGGVVVAGGLGVGGYFLFKPSPKYDGPAGNLGPGIVQANAPVRW